MAGRANSASGRRARSPSIMIPALRHFQRLCLAFPRHPIHQAMLPCDPPRPPAAEILPQGLGLAGAAERVPHAFLESGVTPDLLSGVRPLPVEILVPGSGREGEVHGSI